MLTYDRCCMIMQQNRHRRRIMLTRTRLLRTIVHTIDAVSSRYCSVIHARTSRICISYSTIHPRSISTSTISLAPNASYLRLDKHNQLLLSVEVKAGAMENRLSLSSSADGSSLHVRLSAVAVDGAANRALVSYLATAIGVRKSALTIMAGTTSRHKTIRIDSNGDSGSDVQLTRELLVERIQSAVAADDDE